MTSRDFHLGDILTITHGRLLSPTKMEGVYRILSFVVGDDVYTHQIPRVVRECKPWLLRQHPQLGSPEVDFEVAKLGLMLETPSGSPDPETLVRGWLLGMVARYGATLPVEPIPMDDHDRIDPVVEAERLFEAERVVAVRMEGDPS